MSLYSTVSSGKVNLSEAVRVPRSAMPYLARIGAACFAACARACSTVVVASSDSSRTRIGLPPTNSSVLVSMMSICDQPETAASSSPYCSKAKYLPSGEKPMMRRAAASPAWAAETIVNSSAAPTADPTPYRTVIARPAPISNPAMVPAIYGQGEIGQAPNFGKDMAFGERRGRENPHRLLQDREFSRGGMNGVTLPRGL